jgi:two-component sensor histidine kinase
VSSLTLKARLLLVLALALAPAVVLAIMRAGETVSADPWGDIGLILMIALAGLGVLWIGAERWCLRPLKPIQAVVAAIARGNFAVRPPIGPTTPEIQALAKDVFTMAEAITVREAALQVSLDQREHMLREIHHRVKNNLQVISSLLSLQAGKVRSPRLRRMFSDAQGRMLAMSVVHRHLYERSDWSTVDFKAYICDLVGHLSANRRGGDAPTVICHVEAPVISVSPDTAIPVGLIVTEAVSNAFRHGFAGVAAPEVRISAREVGGDIEVRIEDNGVGFEETRDTMREERGLGLALMQGLAAQLGGTITIEPCPGGVGICILARFPKPRAAATILQPKAEEHRRLLAVSPLAT